jgi:hypothetical protein
LICGPWCEHSEADWDIHEIVRLALAADQKARKNPQGSAPCGYEKAPDFSEAVVFV